MCYTAMCAGFVAPAVYIIIKKDESIAHNSVHMRIALEMKVEES